MVMIVPAHGRAWIRHLQLGFSASSLPSESSLSRSQEHLREFYGIDV
jgi:hypothetical protein